MLCLPLSGIFVVQIRDAIVLRFTHLLDCSSLLLYILLNASSVFVASCTASMKWWPCATEAQIFGLVLSAFVSRTCRTGHSFVGFCRLPLPPVCRRRKRALTRVPGAEPVHRCSGWNRQYGPSLAQCFAPGGRAGSKRLNLPWSSLSLPPALAARIFLSWGSADHHARRSAAAG